MRCTDKEKLDAVAESLKKAGYEPHDQMYGYLTISGVDVFSYNTTTFYSKYSGYKGEQG